MNKRITSLVLVFVMVLSLLATAVPVLAAPVGPNDAEYSVEADKTSAAPGEEIKFTVYIQQNGNLNVIEARLKIPTGLTYIPDSGALAENIQATLGWDATDWTPDPYMMVNGFGAESYTGTDKLALMTFKCTVDSDTPAGDYEVTLHEFFTGDDTYIEKPTTCIPATITVTAAPKPATDITLNRSELTLTVDDTETLVATVTPSDTTDTVAWSSDKPGVATVDSTGKVTAVAPGTAVIAARAGEKSAFCTVTVVAAPCTHTDKTNVDAKPSTCKEQGWEAYSKCNDCGQLFDKDGNEISAIPYLSLAAHSLTPVAAKAATCTENGNKAYYKCDVCGKWFEDATANVEITDHSSVVLTALGHDYTERIEDAAHKKATATDCRSHDTYWYDCTRGDHNAKDDPAASDKWYESTNTGPHSYDESAWGYKSESGHAHKCRYDDTHDTPVAHTPGAAATETTPQTCTECGYIITPALGHTHSMTKVDANPASCTEKGNIEYYKCDGCGKLFTDATGNVELTADQVVVAATGHDYEWKIDKEATATEKGSKHEECKNCGDKKAAVEIPATGTPTTPTEPNKPADTKSPQTGDNSNMILWIALLIASGSATGITLLGKKRKMNAK